MGPARRRAGGSAGMDLMPERIIRGGPYRFTRNPMYLGMTSMYLGVTLCKNWAWPVFCLPFVWWVMNAYVIAREERYLEAKFGDDYRRYKARVRRWL